MTTRLQIVVQAAVEREVDGLGQTQQVQVPPISAFSAEAFQRAWGEIGSQLATLFDEGEADKE